MWHLVYSILCTMLAVGESKQPNFIIMYMDDMGWGDLGIYGHPTKETSNLDRMANEGTLFTDFYTASAICSPSRASIMTGRLPVRNGFYSTNEKAKNSYTPQEVLGGIADKEVLFPEVLKQHGYRNKIVGKWHLGHRPQYLPLRHGFHEWFGAPNCHYKYDNIAIPNIPVYKNEEMTGRYYDDYVIDHETGLGNLTQLYVEEALEFIEKQAAKDEPFLLYWAPDATHTPLYASKAFRGKSQRGLYGDAVMEIDDGVGRIFSKLKELNLDENTFSFFSSDNGAATYAFTHGGSNGPFLCGKQTTFEGGFRQPAIVRWPGKIPASKVSRQVGNTMDIFLTLLDFANISAPSDVTFDGSSLKEAMLSGKNHDRPTFYYRGDTLFKVRVGQYKAHYYTWNSPADAQAIGYHYCPGEFVANLTTEKMTDLTSKPILIHLGRDPGEKFPIDPNTAEYKSVIQELNDVRAEHLRSMKRGEPQLNWCDLAIQNWRPRGCEKINRCLKVPPSYRYRCEWPY